MANAPWDDHGHNNKFKIDFSPYITKMSPLKITLDRLETTNGADGFERTFRPGIQRVEQITFEIAEDPDDVKAWRPWILQCQQGQRDNYRKNITVDVMNQKGETLRSFNLLDCIPVSINSITLDAQAGATTKHTHLTIDVNRVEWTS